MDPARNTPPAPEASGVDAQSLETAVQAIARQVGKQPMKFREEGEEIVIVWENGQKNRYPFPALEDLHPGEVSRGHAEKSETAPEPTPRPASPDRKKSRK